MCLYPLFASVLQSEISSTYLTCVSIRWLPLWRSSLIIRNRIIRCIQEQSSLWWSVQHHDWWTKSLNNLPRVSLPLCPDLYIVLSIHSLGLPWVCSVSFFPHLTGLCMCATKPWWSEIRVTCFSWLLCLKKYKAVGVENCGNCINT